MKKNSPIFISIITICLNEEERIDKTLSSIIAQTYQNRELIVIDGASTDGTLEIINQHKNDITHLLSEKDDGIYYAMNKGIALAKGDYIIFMNGGDIFFNKDVLFDVFSRENISEGIIYGNVCYVYPSGNSSINHLPQKIDRLFLTNNTINHQSAFCKSTLFTRLKGFDTKYSIASDYDFFVRAIVKHNCSTKHVPLTVSYFYKDGISHTGKTKSIMRNERLKIQDEHFPRALYYFTRCRYWLIAHKNTLFPKWLQIKANSLFHHFFKSGKPSGKWG